MSNADAPQGPSGCLVSQGQSRGISGLGVLAVKGFSRIRISHAYGTKIGYAPRGRTKTCELERLTIRVMDGNFGGIMSAEGGAYGKE